MYIVLVMSMSDCQSAQNVVITLVLMIELSDWHSMYWCLGSCKGVVEYLYMSTCTDRWFSESKMSAFCTTFQQGILLYDALVCLQSRLLHKKLPIFVLYCASALFGVSLKICVIWWRICHTNDTCCVKNSGICANEFCLRFWLAI